MRKYRGYNLLHPDELRGQGGRAVPDQAGAHQDVNCEVLPRVLLVLLPAEHVSAANHGRHVHKPNQPVPDIRSRKHGANRRPDYLVHSAKNSLQQANSTGTAARTVQLMQHGHQDKNNKHNTKAMRK